METVSHSLPHSRVFARGPRVRVFVTISLLIAAGLIFWRASNVFFLFFLSVLFALVLRALAGWAIRWLHFPKRWALEITIAILLAAFSATGFFVAPEVQEQFGKLRDDLPRAVESLKSRLNQSQIGRMALSFGQSAGANNSAATFIPKAANFVSSAGAALLGVVLVAFTTVYLASDSERYVQGFLKLFPKSKRARLREVFCELGSALQRVVLGQLCLMALNGIVTGVGLWLLGVPLAFTLGLISGALNFIPNFGPIIAAIPGTLIASLQGTNTAIYVIILYFAYQNIDGYVLTPLVQKRAVSLPPALVLMAQVLFGILFGTLGVLVAVPFTAMILILVKTLYIEDLLREPVTIPGNPQC